MDRYLAETPMLDFSHPAIQRLVEQRGWRGLGKFKRIRAIYGFVRDEVLFGYNVDDAIPASCSWRCFAAAESPAASTALPSTRNSRRARCDMETHQMSDCLIIPPPESTLNNTDSGLY